MKRLSALITKLSVGLVIFAFLISAKGWAQDAAMEAYRQGDLKNAAQLLGQELNRANASGNLNDRWASYFRNAWFLVETDNLKQAVEFFNEALSLARQLKDPALEGKTLSELGLAYSHLGFYEVASKIYLRAIQLGAPKNKITFPQVWGQATQELGALHLAMGNLDLAEKTLLKTYHYAQEHGILPGISEGGAYLANLYLLRGNFGKAEDFAQSALRAGLTCDCSPYINSWTQTMLARVLLEKQKMDPTISARQISDLLIDAQKNAQKYHNLRSQAEVLILQSRLLSKNEKKKRLSLLETAYEILIKMNSELRAASAAEVGRAYLAENEKKLAEFYLKNGLEINKKLFRKIDQWRRR